MINYLRYTDTDTYLAMLAHGIDQETAYNCAEITHRCTGDIRTAIAQEDGLYVHCAIVQIAPGEEPKWIALWSNSPEQPRYPSQWILIHWAKDSSEPFEVDPADYCEWCEND